MAIPAGYLSTGVLTRPTDTTILQINIVNNTSTLQFQTFYIYSLDSGSAVLLQSKNYFMPPNGTNLMDFPLVLTNYNDKRNIILYEVVYGPSSPGIIVTFSNI